MPGRHPDARLPGELADEAWRRPCGRLTTRRVFLDLAIAMAAFGLLVGALFPLVVVWLGVAPPGAAFQPRFVWSCLGAGLVVGGMNHALARAVVGTRLKRQNLALRATRAVVARAARTPVRPGDLTRAGVPVDSLDDFGTMSRTFNEVLADLEDSWVTQRSLQDLARAAGEVWPAEANAATVCHQLLTVLVDGDPRIAAARVTGPDGEVLAVVAAEVAGTGSDGPTRDRVRPVPGHGVLHLAVHVPADAPDEGRSGADLARGAAEVLALALSRLDLVARVQRQACVDELTGLLNRREGVHRIQEALASAGPRAGLGVLMVDLDHFKQVNDVHGHLRGDEVLRGFGRVCREVLRAGDVACRYGGEEVLVLAVDVDLDAVRELAERLRRAVAAAESPSSSPAALPASTPAPTPSTRPATAGPVPESPGPAAGASVRRSAGPGDTVRAVVDVVLESTETVVRQVAVAVVAQRQISVGVLVVVAVFLLVQDRLDRNDPKLAAAPLVPLPDLPYEPPTNGEDHR
ncbi:diguanylate cyclase [Kineococcus sp. NPDC059986]|uniref:diguanylate cyclase n=1 Tax=Kineococcus sp. NPDC059986 TaxID=3155538 RepID=UPI00344F799D